MDDPALMIGLAFVLGYLVRQIGLPPLVGFLAAGFLLRGVWDVGYTEGLGQIADLGVTLMLFTIGLKLKPRDLAQTPVWLGSTLHLVLTVALFLPLLMAGGAVGIPLLDSLSWSSGAIVAFALAFSSTVFAVVMSQSKGEMNADYAKLAIGILIMQDIFAVIFLTASKGQVPTLMALPLVIGLVLARKPLGKLLARSGHGELLVLSGLLLPIGAYELFELVNLKGDLGALFLGVLLANAPKADELSKLLFGFKELLLVTFFLSIGLQGDPSMDVLLVAGLLVLVLPIKTFGFYFLLTRLGVPARTATFSTLSLSNFSEFGLIVGALAASKGWIEPDWLLVFAIALSVTYVIAAPATMASEGIFQRYCDLLHRFERDSAKPVPVDLEDRTIMIVGLGRMGEATYRRIAVHDPELVVGIDYDQDTIERHRLEGMHCVRADATDHEFWQGLDLSGIEAVLLTTPNHHNHLDTVTCLRDSGYHGFIAASTAHEDQAAALREAGANAAYGLYDEAGTTFGDLVWDHLGHLPTMKVAAVQRPPTRSESRPETDIFPS